MQLMADGPARKPYPTDVSDEEWAFVAPSLTLLRDDAAQRAHSLREVFNGVRYLVRAGCAWRVLPNDLPPWAAVYHVYQQMQRWIAAGVFEAMVHDLRVVLRLAEVEAKQGQGRAPHPTAMILMVPRSRARPKAGPAQATTATRSERAARCTWRSTR